MPQSNQYMQTDCAHGRFDRHPLPVQHCHPVLDFAGGHVHPTAYPKKIPDSTPGDNACAAMEQSSGYIPSSGICLYGIVYCNLWNLPIHLRVFNQSVWIIHKKIRPYGQSLHYFP